MYATSLSLTGSSRSRWNIPSDHRDTPSVTSVGGTDLASALFRATRAVAQCTKSRHKACPYGATRAVTLEALTCSFSSDTDSC